MNGVYRYMRDSCAHDTKYYCNSIDIYAKYGKDVSR